MPGGIKSGAIDVVVVEQKDSSLKSSSFHVRFSSLSRSISKFKSKDKKEVFISINDDIIPLRMYLGEKNECYFISECDDDPNWRYDCVTPPPVPFFGISGTSNDTSSMSHSSDEDIDFLSPLDDQSAFLQYNAESPSASDFFAPSYEFTNLRTVSAPLFEESEDTLEDKEISNNSSGSTKSSTLSPYENESDSQINPTSLLFNLDNIEFSMCGGDKFYSYDSKKQNKKFDENKLKYQSFWADNDILHNTEIVCRIDGKMYPLRNALRLICSSLLFGKIPSPELFTVLSNDGSKRFKIKNRKFKKAENMRTSVYKKSDIYINKPNMLRQSLRPTSVQLKEMNLKYGNNHAMYFISTESGRKEVHGNIYLVKWSDQIIISDIDGTITKSDVLGHISNFIGKDWSQAGIAKFYTAIRENGYHIFYISARSITMSESTRNYLKAVKQENLYSLPVGPVLVAPFGLFNSLKKEVILRIPQEYKTKCVANIGKLFPPEVNPFYSGFGNKPSDVVTYEAIGISRDRVYIVDKTGLIKTLNKTYETTYSKLNSLVEVLFPAVSEVGTGKYETKWSDTSYWRVPIPEYNLSKHPPKKDKKLSKKK